MNRIVVLLFSAAMLFSCAKEKASENKADESSTNISELEQPEISDLDIQGHRGARGYYPENTLEGFKIALEIGVSTLEMDAVISKDGVVVLSHEPWISHSICTDKKGNTFTEEKEKKYNIYKMKYEEIEKFKCGTLMNPRFPDQIQAEEPKPKLSDIISGVEKLTTELNREATYYNIETKSSPEGDNLYHPEPQEFVQKLVKVIQEGGIENRTIIQSFDIRTLQVAHEQYPEIKLALLVEGNEDGIEKLDKLGFTPEIYSPNFESLDQELVEGLQEKGMKVIPWTVNEPEDIEKLIVMGVDGIISDYPDRVIKVRQDQLTGRNQELTK